MIMGSDKKKLMKIANFFAILLVFGLLTGAAAAARVYLDITSPDFRKVPVAVPYFVNKAGSRQVRESDMAMADLLARGLTFHGFIAVPAADSYGGRQDIKWRDLGVDFAVLGRYEAEDTNIVLELQLLDVNEDRTVFGRRYKGPWQIKEKMILKFCDEVIMQLTGEAGVSRSRIAFVSDKSGYKEIYLADVLGEEVQQVTRHQNLAVSPRFSPDGGLLAYTSYHRGNPNLYVTNLAQSQTTRALSRRKGLNLAPAWAPDGKTMAITLSKDGNPDLYLMNSSGEILKQLTKNAGINVSPSWSPDGRQLVFVSDRSGTPQLYVMDMKTRSVNRITFKGSDNSEPNWSPKGDWITYSGLAEGNYHIFIIRPEGGQAVQLTTDRSNHESPSWSPDGRQIVFARHRDQDRQICAIYKNGSGLRPLFREKGRQTSPQWSPRESK